MRLINFLTASLAIAAATASARPADSQPAVEPTTNVVDGASDGDAALLLTQARTSLELIEDALLHALLSRAKLASTNLEDERAGVAEAFKTINGNGDRDGDKDDKVKFPSGQWEGKDGMPKFLNLASPLPDPVDQPGTGKNKVTLLEYFFSHYPAAMLARDDNDDGKTKTAAAGGKAKSSAVLASATALQLLSDRIALGKLVAQAKFAQNKDKLCPLIVKGDSAAIQTAVTNTDQETAVYNRVTDKAQAWSPDPFNRFMPRPPVPGNTTANIDNFSTVTVDLFRNYLVPITTQYEVIELLAMPCK